MGKDATPALPPGLLECRRPPSPLAASPDAPAAKRPRFDEDSYKEAPSQSVNGETDRSSESDESSTSRPKTVSPSVVEAPLPRDEQASLPPVPAMPSEPATFESSKTATISDILSSGTNSAFSATSAVSVKTKAVQPISTESKFESFAEFEEAFELWKRVYFHPFRVASSETLREPDGAVNEVFKYRYIVYHCAHYGTPRMRGVGKRPNQNYLPCGCRAMLRLNYNFNEKVLKVTTLNDQHTEHEWSAESYAKVASKIRRSPVGSPSTRRSSSLKVKCETQSPQSQSTPSPSESVAAAQAAQCAAGLSNIAAITLAIQQQQRLAAAALLAQHKENLAQHHSPQPAPLAPPPGLPRPTPHAPQSTPFLPFNGNLLNMLAMPSLYFPSPNYGLVPQALPPAVEPSPSLEALQQAPLETARPPMETPIITHVKQEVASKPDVSELVSSLTAALESASDDTRKQQALALLQQWKANSDSS